MRYYKVVYKIGENKGYEYPDSIRGIVWSVAQYHFTEKVMIGGTDSEIKADGVEVIELTEKEALSLIAEFKKSYPKPEVPKREFPFSIPEVPGKESPFHLAPEKKEEMPPKPAKTKDTKGAAKKHK